MSGHEQLKRSFSGWTAEQVCCWLERGLRTLADERESDEWDLAFRPLLLSSAEPPLQQFHFALEELGSASLTKVRVACGDLLRAWRLQDSVEYLRTLWSVALSLKPVGGVVDAARHLTASASGDRRLIERLRPVFDVILTTVLAYPDDEEQQAFLSDFARSPIWTADYSRQLVLHRIRQRPSRWLEWVRQFEPALRESPDRYFARLVRAVGPAELGRGIPRLNPVERLDWLLYRVKPHFMYMLRGDVMEVRVGDESAFVELHLAGEDELIQVEAVLGTVATYPAARANDPEQRMSVALARFSSFGTLQ